MGETMGAPSRSVVQVLVLLGVGSIEAGLLGAGKGGGSCAAAPFRTPVSQLQWPGGCPASAPCCSEFGYCHSRENWAAGGFRDCNGQSNGRPLEAGATGFGAGGAGAPGFGAGGAGLGGAGASGFGAGGAGFGAGGAGGAGAAGFGAGGAGTAGFGAGGAGAGAGGAGAAGFGAGGDGAGAGGAGGAGN